MSATSPAVLEAYVRRFGDLKRNRNARLGDAPHKPVLLLAILDGIERGEIRENRVRLNPFLVAAFQAFWRALVPDRPPKRVVYPFRYLVGDGFWILEKAGRDVGPRELGDPTSIPALAAVADAGRFDDALWELLQNPVSRAVLRRTLLDTYFPDAAPAPALPADPLEAAARRLTEEARTTRFRQKVTSTVRDSDVGYLRHSLFPRVVKELYDHACAVCRLGVRDDRQRTLVEAAHILKFATFGNDDPRNGVALCPNHHQGFDHGWFGIRDDYTVVASPRVAGEGYVVPGAAIALPTLPDLAPDPAALAWHREHVLLR